MTSKITLFFVLLFLGGVGASDLKAQMNYTVAYPTTTFTAITGGTTPTLTLAYPTDLAATEGITAIDEGAANNVTLPFTFKFNGVNYTTCHISTNGFLSFGTALGQLNTYWGNNLMSGPYNGPSNGVANDGTGSRPLIAPLWDDLGGTATGYIQYVTSGTAPYRVFTVQWLNAKWSFQATSAGISFQVKLYETTNIIECIYRQQTGTVSAGTEGASIGLADVLTGSGKFLSLSGVTSAATASSTTEVANIRTKPATNFAIRFTPSAIVPISLLSFKAVKDGKSNRLDWVTATEVNNKRFDVEKSSNGIRFESIGFVAGNNKPSTYEFIDNAPLATSYYRLRQMDNDGKETLSKVISVEREDAINRVSIKVYPNPVSNTLTVENTEGSDFQILNLLGQQVLTGKTPSGGRGLDVSALPHGTYMLRVGQEVAKFVKL